MRFRFNLTAFIFLCMLLGIVTGSLVFSYADSPHREAFATQVSLLTDIFLRLIKMILAPLVFSTLVVGIAKIGDIQTIGKIGGKTMLWFVSASIVSLVVGMIIMNIAKVGAGAHLVDTQNTITVGKSISFKNFILHLIPKSIAEAMADNEILQIVVFSIFFGLATSSIGKKSEIIIHFLDSVAHVVLKMTSYVMYLSPLAAFAGLAGVVATNGPSILHTYLSLAVAFFTGIFILWLLLIGAGYVFLKKRIFELLRIVFPSFLLAFSTATSESAYPTLIKQLKQFGCKEKIITLVLPLGYSFNLDGSMMYTTFASLFIAQAYGIHLTFQEQLTMLGMLMVTSKGIAGTPRASLVIVASTLAAFKIPEAGIALLLGVAQIFDMARTGTNLIGNSIATAVVCHTEKELTARLPSEDIETS